MLPGDLAVVVGVDVDEAGRDDAALGVDLLGAARGDAPADRRDPPAGNGDVGFEGRAAGPVDDEAAANDQIESTSHPPV